MEELVAKLTELLEEDSLDITKPFKAYDAWDSFTALSILSLLDADYHKQMTYKQLNEFASIEEFCKQALA